MIEEKQLKDLERSFWIDKGVIILLLILLCIQGVSALDYKIYSGDTINITLDKPYVYYSIVGNSSEVLLDIEQIGNVIFITFDKYMKDDSFEIVFFDIEKEVITVYQSGGGSGGGGPITITKKIIKEVPTYLTEWKTNETIKIVENKTTETKYVDTVDIGEIKWYFVILGSLGVGIIIWIFVYFMKRMEKSNSKENNTDERGLEENE